MSGLTLSIEKAPFQSLSRSISSPSSSESSCPKTAILDFVKLARGAAGTSSEIKSPENPLPPVVGLCSNWRWPGGTETSSSLPRNETVNCGDEGVLGSGGVLLMGGTEISFPWSQTGKSTLGFSGHVGRGGGLLVDGEVSAPVAPSLQSVESSALASWSIL